MSDKPIQVGDLVMVVRPPRCGCPSKNIGKIFTVAFLKPTNGLYIGCDHEAYSKLCAVSHLGIKIDIPRLKRIDPDCLRDDVREAEKLPTKEPA